MNLPRQLLLCGVLLVFGPAYATMKSTTDFSLEEKVGQLFLIGFSEKSVNTQVKRLLKEIRPGGFILFRRNLGGVDEIRKFTSELRDETVRATRLSPLLAVDQEGGSVVRIPVFPSLPSAYSVGATKDRDISNQLGQETGKILRWSGFNMNLAPVLDLSDPARASFIGPRSYGPDPDITGAVGTAFAEGLKQAGVLPTAKHFPGLGGILADPHVAVSGRKSSMEDLRKSDLKPFEAYATLGENSALMVSQLSYPGIDPKGEPAPFSRKILHDLLRGELGYKGLVITDDLQMKGTSAVIAPEEAAYRSLKAGADMVMITWSLEQQKKAVARVVRAIREGDWDASELNERFARIVRVKTFLNESNVEDDALVGRGPHGEPATKRLEKIDLRILDANIRKTAWSNPVAGSDDPDCVVAAHSQFIDSYRKGSGRKFKSLVIGSTMSSKDLSRAIGGCQRIVFAVNGKKTAQLFTAMTTELQKKSILVNLGLPSLVGEKVESAARFEIGYPHFHAGYRIAQTLRSRSP